MKPLALDRPTVERQLAEAEAAHKRAADKLGEAREQMTHAREKFVEHATRASREGKRIAEEDLERAEEIEGRTRDALERARTTMAQLERGEKVERYTAARDRAVAWAGRLEQFAASLIEIDRQADAAIADIARECADAIADADRAEGLAEELRMTPDFDRHIPRRPSLPQLRLDLARLVTRVRIDEGRDPLAPHWLAHVPEDWRTAGASAEDLANVEAFHEAQRRDAQVQQTTRERLIAAVNAAQPAHKPTTETSP